MKKSENILLYAVLVLVVISLIFSVSTFFSKSYSREKYNEFISAELEDKCKTPEGYSDEQWREHMSHHPDRYKECLK